MQEQFGRVVFEVFDLASWGSGKGMAKETAMIFEGCKTISDFQLGGNEEVLITGRDLAGVSFGDWDDMGTVGFTLPSDILALDILTLCTIKLFNFRWRCLGTL